MIEILLMVLCIVSIISCIMLVVVLLSQRKELSNLSQTVEMIASTPQKLDVTLKDFNHFIKRAILLSFEKWFINSIGVKNMSDLNHTSSIIGELKSPDMLRKTVTAVCSTVIASMSDSMKKQFFKVYNKNMYETEDDVLSDYISTAVMLYVRKINMDITVLFEEDQETNVDDLVRSYFLELENELNKIYDVEIIPEANESPKPDNNPLKVDDNGGK